MATATKRPKVGDEVKVWTWRDCERAMEFYAGAKAAEARLAADLQADLVELQKVHSAGIERAQRQALEQEALIREFARIHRKEFKSREEGGDTRSHEHADVMIGYRVTPPQVRIEDEDRATEWLIQNGFEYVRTRVEPNREALREVLSNDADPMVEKLAAHGITLQQKDKFFIEITGAK